MLERIFRVLVGFIMACLAAGFTKVLFATPPTEIMNLPSDVQADRLVQLTESALFAAIWSLIFSAPFALIAAAIGEWRRIRSWTYYAIVGLAVSFIGLLTQHSAEQVGQATIMNNYGLAAFITAGFVAGVAYWLFSGRNAGGVGHRPAPLPRPEVASSVAAKPTVAAAQAKPITKPVPAAVPSAGNIKKV